MKRGMHVFVAKCHNYYTLKLDLFKLLNLIHTITSCHTFCTCVYTVFELLVLS